MRRRLDRYSQSVRDAIADIGDDASTATSIALASRPVCGNTARLTDDAARRLRKWENRRIAGVVVATYPRYALVEFASGYREAWHYTDLEVYK